MVNMVTTFGTVYYAMNMNLRWVTHMLELLFPSAGVRKYFVSVIRPLQEDTTPITGQRQS